MALFNFNFKKEEPKLIETPNDTEVNFFTLSEQNSLPQIKEVKGTDYILFGVDNQYPEFLTNLFRTCPTHQAICKTKASMVAGSDIQIDYKDLNETERMRLNSLLYFADGKNTLHTIVKKLALDYQVFGAMSLEIIWSMDYSTITTIKRIDVSKIRSGKLIEDEVTHYYYSRNWKDRQEEIKCIPTFDVNQKQHYNQLMYVKNDTVGIEYYGEPSYSASINAIETDSQIGLYYRAILENGFSPSFAIKFLRKPKTEEEKRSVVQGIKNSFGSAKNAGKLMIFFSDSKDSAPLIEPISVNDLDRQYTVIKTQIINEILTGSRVTSPALFGIRTEATLGNSSEEMKVAYALFNGTVVEPDRLVMEHVINKLIKAAGFNATATLSEFNPLATLA